MGPTDSTQFLKKRMMWKETLAFFVIMLTCGYLYALRVKSSSSSNKKKKKRTTKRTTTTTPSTETKDIEDLGKSLIPRTLKSMKKKKWKALTVQEKLKKRSDLREKKKYTPFRATLVKNKIKLDRTPAQVLQLNIGLYCNQACSHCHVDSTPRRKEMMSRETADHCLRVLRNSPSVKVLDLTGGAPELNREFRHLVKNARSMGIEVIDRCNLTVLLEPRQEGLAAFLRDHQVHIIASLPCYLESNVDSQRGDEVFKRSIEALKRLNRLGYGMGNDDLVRGVSFTYSIIPTLEHQHQHRYSISCTIPRVCIFHHQPRNYKARTRNI